MKNVATPFWTRLVDLASLVATPLVPSHYIALVSPLAATHARKARIEAIDDETGDTRSLTLRPGRGWHAHQPGQHVRVGIVIDGRIATRTYSISSAPGGDLFTITVKSQGRVSNALVNAEIGSYVSIGLPEGDFVLPSPTPAKLAFITAGSGITPVMSMLREGGLRDVVHVHFAKHSRDVIFGAELASLALQNPGYRLVVILTEHDGRRFSRDMLDELIPDWRDRPTWACGPQRLLDSVIDTYGGHELHIERFTAALAPAPANAEGGTVHFATTQRKFQADGRTPLLRIAEDAGVSAPHGCRMGICHTCDTTLVSGCVRDLRTGERIDQAGTRIQVCVCAAAGDVELAL